MNLTMWALVPMAGVACAALAAVLMVLIATRGCAAADRARVLRALAEVVRAVWGKR
ncbi:hypothetical protein ACIBO2_26975 [Nonomuraea sp. NPDC050022]|uniref:hypothetical protein n=1 Tax=unclassified Nonomuraea TaxID=2593643 RepID=UPI0033DF2077